MKRTNGISKIGTATTTTTTARERERERESYYIDKKCPHEKRMSHGTGGRGVVEIRLTMSRLCMPHTAAAAATAAALRTHDNNGTR